jgi:RimJ/RimL family protein N-acetyltransferase
MAVVIDVNTGLAYDRPSLALDTWLRLGHRLAFSCGEVAFTQFEAADTMALHDIRNHPSVRPFMPSPEPVPLERHREWVRAQLLEVHAQSPLVLVGRASGEPVAFGLLKPTADADALEVGVMVKAPWQRGLLPTRLGVALFSIAARVFGTRTLVSHVKHSHDQALRLNRGAGLLPAETSGKPGETCFRTPIGRLLSTPLYRRSARGLVIEVRPAPDR